MSNLYDRDFHAWAEEQATLLRERRFELLDLDNVTQEVEDLARSERRRLQSALLGALIHLLKIAYTEGSLEPQRSWRISVRNARKDARRALREQPSLQAHLTELLRTAFEYARQDAHDELSDHGDTHAPFPKVCPWSIEQILADDFFPQRQS
jgi:hypothetical protein